MSTTRMDTQITLFGAALAASLHTAAGAHIGGLASVLPDLRHHSARRC
jgi:hypothetical protein